ncbi:PLP-dependent cysteine synthase family protein [Agrobacterium rosae]|uniref:PLP-dependent cysteine synthase family protein n=1 Tax=Agrobacterium rosae TaxID=1972867 RepID=UPI003A8100C8
MIVKSMSELIGNTPALRIGFQNGAVELFIKLEIFNPCGSMKDRMALSMLNAVEKQSGFYEGLDIVESSSGNTATALSMLCSERGHKFIAVMDGHAAPDKINAVRALGGGVILVGDEQGELLTAAREDLAHKLADENESTYCTTQHENPANPAGYQGLADEIVSEIGADIVCVIGAVGTGGSLCGTARALSEMIPALRVIGVEPEGSIIFGGPAHKYLQSGTGTPDGASVGLVVDYAIIDEGRKVSDADAFATCRVLAKRYGLMVGGSAGGAIYEAINFCLTAPVGSKVVTFACDAGTKYMGTIFNDAWLHQHVSDIDARIERFENLLLEMSDYTLQQQSARALRSHIAHSNRPTSAHVFDETL